MEETFFVKGDDIITQDDLGDTFFVLELGVVSVTRKSNAYEPRRELKKLRANSHFGELALLNEEPRSATITVISETAKCLRMTKTKFDEIIAVTKMFNIGSRAVISDGAADKVPLFKTLSAATRVKLLENMGDMIFSPGAYICRQGTVGNIFYIITEGSCKITINTDDWKEKEVNRMHAGDYFGEAALLDPYNRRTANVVAFDKVKCMTLTKADFGFLLKGVRSVLVQIQKMRIITDQQALGKTKLSAGRGGSSGIIANNTIENSKKESNNLFGKNDNSINRRISMMSNKGFRIESRVPTIINRLGKFLSESLYLSLYSRMYKDMLINEMKVIEFGEIAGKIMRENNEYIKAVNAIRKQVRMILEKEPSFRSTEENLFISGLLTQKNGLRDRLTKGWPGHQFYDLCRTIKIVRVKSMKRVIDLGSRGTTAYLILRGAVRIFSGAGKEDLDSMNINSPKALQYEEDLVAGEYFGEAVLSGVHARTITALAITPCDLISFEDDDFLASQDASINMSMEDRMNFLSQVSFFKNWDSYRLYRVAHALTQINKNKGYNIIKNDEISNNIYFVLRGRVDIFPSSRSKTVLLSIQKYEYFGESGFMNLCTHNNTKRPNQFVENFCMKASTRVDLLILPENEFHLLDRDTINIISETFYARKIWRERRSSAVIQEMKVFHDFKNKLRNDYDDKVHNKEKEKEKEKGREKQIGEAIRNNFLTPLSHCEYVSNTQNNSQTTTGQYTPRVLFHHDYHPNQSSTSLCTSSCAIAVSRQSGSAPSLGINYNDNNNNHQNKGNNNALQALNYQLSLTLQNMMSNNSDYSNYNSSLNSNFNSEINSRRSSIDSIANARSNLPNSNLNFNLNSNSPSISALNLVKNGNSAGSGFGTNSKMGNNNADKYHLGSTYMSSENVPRLLNLDDIPSLLNNNFDPLMRVSTAINKKNKIKVHNNSMSLKTPQLARVNDCIHRLSQSDNIEYHREMALIKYQPRVQNIENADSGSLSNRSSVSLTDARELVRNHSLGLSVILNSKITDNNDTIEKNINSIIKNGDYNVNDDDNPHSICNDEYISKTGFERSMLFGSGRIPSVKSYCETLTSSDRYPKKER